MYNTWFYVSRRITQPGLINYSPSPIHEGSYTGLNQLLRNRCWFNSRTTYTDLRMVYRRPTVTVVVGLLVVCGGLRSLLEDWMHSHLLRNGISSISIRRSKEIKPSRSYIREWASVLPVNYAWAAATDVPYREGDATEAGGRQLTDGTAPHRTVPRWDECNSVFFLYWSRGL